MARLSDTQAAILSKASQRPDGNLLPLPGSLRGGAAAKVVGALLGRGLIREQVTPSQAIADAALNTFWRTDQEGRGILLLVTNAGLEAIGVEPDTASESATGTQRGTGGTDDASGMGTATTAVDGARPKVRAGTKQAKLIEMLRAPDGASIDEITAATGWQPHTVRGAIAGALKKRLDLDVVSEKTEARGRVYRIPG